MDSSRINWRLCAVSFIATASVALSSGCGTDAKTIRGTVVRTIDGDTLIVDTKGKETKIRLAGIDAPELHQEGGPESFFFLTEMIDHQAVKVVWDKKDLYGRTVGTVFNSSNMNINEAMVAHGQAWFYVQYGSKFPQYREDERAARAEKKGLWRNENPEPPWQFRREHKMPKKLYKRWNATGVEYLRDTD